jgi:two-component system sensor histidine kinase UhpB
MQQLYESLVQSIEAIIWEVDAQTLEATFVSKQVERVLGYSKDEWMKAPNFWLNHIHPDDRERVFNAKMQLAATGNSGHFDYRMFAKDGRTIWLRDIVSMREHDSMRLRGVKVDITDRKRSEEQLEATTEQLRALSARLSSAMEEERIRVAREIHDELGSELTSLKWGLASLDRLVRQLGSEPDFDPLLAKIESLSAMADIAIGGVKRISAELRPSILDESGLSEAIEWQAEQFQTRTGIECEYSLQGPELNQEQSTAVFRITQEALTNILRHAQATRVAIKTWQEGGEFVLAIRDNGRGISDEQKSGHRSLGLLGMRERARLVGGTVDVSGIEGEGTTVTVRAPLQAG